MFSKIIYNETVRVLTIKWCAVMLSYYIRDLLLPLQNNTHTVSESV